MKIDNFNLDNDTFIVAELSANHAGSLEIAKKSIYGAKRAGASAVKIQTYSADSLALDAKKDSFKLNSTIWKDRYLYDLYKEIAMPYSYIEPLFNYAKEIGITMFSTPFSLKDLDIIKKFDPPCYKIASFEINHLPLISEVAKLHKPVIISCGVATISEIDDALKCCYDVGNKDIILLKCVSEYPANIANMNLSTITDMKNRFKVKVGLSDHSLGIVAPVVATTLGACMVEKHFKLDDSITSADSSFSLNLKEFGIMVKTIKEAKMSMGDVEYSSSGEFLKRGIYASRDISKGEIFDGSNIALVRPSGELSPKYYAKLLGKKAKREISFADPIIKDDL